jgi:hypothetical protein
LAVDATPARAYQIKAELRLALKATGAGAALAGARHVPRRTPRRTNLGRQPAAGLGGVAGLSQLRPDASGDGPSALDQVTYAVWAAVAAPGIALICDPLSCEGFPRDE